MKLKNNIVSLLTVLPLSLFAQFDGIVWTTGCKAIHCDDLRILEWATGCTVTRGYQNIALPANGYASYGTDNDAIGKVQEDLATTKAVSLGDSGIAILTFHTPIVNGEGYDFAVFENSFSDDYLELAFVEVSSDSIHYYRFPATSNTPIDKQTGPYASTDATLINNLAGKYRVGWGTPFDLEELLPADEGLDINNIRYVKVIDVVGSIKSEYATYDVNGNAVNDPYPTNFASGGFDLTGVAVMNNQTNVGIADFPEWIVSAYPNPCRDFILIRAEVCRMSLYSIAGQKLQEDQTTDNLYRLDMSSYPAGIYMLHLQSNRSKKTVRIIKQ
ncbi:MAG: T9SS type A sorting domain-containing protein [Bacteroidales bacterium]|nr:T9SS type A sorting domain-containing protein [Bacteroidales bacterium]